MKNIKLVITGHVDHGKSTLIGRLLYDTGSLTSEKMKEIDKVSKELGKDAELAFLTDQLKEEREKNITIDTAQIPFSYKGHEFTIIDAPGHVEFTRNMLTGASQADIAINIIDAGAGIEEQTMRHLYLLDFIGIGQVLPIINKMDTVDFDEARFRAIASELKEKCSGFKFSLLEPVPISAYEGEGIVKKSKKMPFASQPLLKALTSIKITDDLEEKPFEMCIQDHYLINDQHIDVGMIASGELISGSEVTLLPGGEKIKIEKILKFEGEKKKAGPKENIGLVASQKLERGKVLSAKPGATASDIIEANIFWLEEKPATRGSSITIKLESQQTQATIEQIEKVIDTSTLQEVSSTDQLAQNQAGRVKLQLAQPVYSRSFADSEEFGRFVLEHDYSIHGAGIIY